MYWMETNRKILSKINSLIKECQRTPSSGAGNPEALKQNLSGYWSRRINSEHRLVYRVEDNVLYIAQCRYHY
jgi:toxin YoeB